MQQLKNQQVKHKGNIIKELKDKLLTFENNKTSYPISEALPILQTITSEIAKKNSHLIIYSFIYKKEHLVRSHKVDFKYYSKFFIFYIIWLQLIPQLKAIHSFFYKKPPFFYIEEFISELKLNKQLDINEYKIDFYTFKKKDKSKKRNFEKLYQLIYNELFSYQTRYSNIFFGGLIESTASFFIDSYNVISKYFIFILGSLLIYTIYYYRYLLELLGIPANIISNLQIVSIIKLYGSIMSPLFLYTIPPTILYMYVLSKSSLKHTLYQSFKFFLSLLFYVFIISIFIKLNFLNIEKNDINIKDFFLKQYFGETIFPKIIENNSTKKFIVGSDGKLLYYYSINKIFKTLDKKRGDINMSKQSLESMSIYLLKNSIYTDVKNIKIMSTKQAIKEYKFLNREESQIYIQQEYPKYNKD